MIRDMNARRRKAICRHVVNLPSANLSHLLKSRAPFKQKIIFKYTIKHPNYKKLLDVHPSFVAPAAFAHLEVFFALF